jgi:hypothetical protein
MYQSYGAGRTLRLGDMAGNSMHVRAVATAILIGMAVMYG